MDYRDVAGHYRTVLQNVDTRHLTATVEDGDGNEHTVKLKFDVCETCNGRGQYVNPSIDSHGLSREDFDDDPDFEEGYFAGRYDVRCGECDGERLVPVVDPERNTPELVALVEALEQDAWDYARDVTREREMGC